MITRNSSTSATDQQFLAGAGEMVRITRTHDWTSSSLGPIETWPQSLKTTLGIVLNSKFPMVLLWGTDLICFYNDAFRPSLGPSGKHPAVGRKANEVWPEAWSFIEPLVQKVLNVGESSWFEDQEVPTFRNNRIENIYWTFSYSPVYGDDGGISGVFVTCIETTAKVTARRALEESNNRFQQLITQATVGTIVLIGSEYIVEIVNDAYAKLIGKKTAELVGKKLFDIIPAATEPFRSVLDGVRLSGNARYLYEQPYSVNTADSKVEGFLDLVYQPYRNDVGDIVGVMVGCQDVSEKVRARKEIQRSEERFEAAVQAVEGIIWTNNAKGEMVGEQPAWSALTGQTFEEYQGFGWANAVHPDDAQASVDAWNEVVREMRVFEFRHRLRVKNGTYRLFSIRAIPLKDTEGNIIEWVGVHTDITEVSRAQEILKESEMRFRSLADNSPMIVYIVEPNEIASMSYFNKTWLDYTGQNFEAAIGRAWDGIVHPADLQQILDIYLPAFRQRTSYTLPAVRLRRYDGEYRWHLFKGNPRFADGQFIGFVGMGIDIHEQTIVQHALQESEERFRNLADHAPMFIWMVDTNGTITYANRALLYFIGIAEEGAVATVGGWESVTHPDDLPNVYQSFIEGLTSRKPYTVEARLRNHQNGGYEWFFFKAAPRELPGGEFTGFIGTAVNIHQQKTLLVEMEERVQLRTHELNVVNEALLQSNEDLKQFAHVASHDLKEPVRKIQTFSHRLNDEFGNLLNGKAQNYLQKILRSTDRMSAMIDGVLNYSSISAQTETEIEKIDLNSIIDNIIIDLEVLIAKKSGSVEKNDLPVIEGSEVLLYQLFYNLINNSLKFSRPDVPPRVLVECLSAGETEIVITVSDNGIGFEKKYADRIFESFTRLNTKDQFEGTGLGLSLCKKIVQRHQGTIDANGIAGEGASFSIRLPRSQSVDKI